MWMTRNVLRRVKRKHNLWNKWKESNNEIAYLKYKRQANKASKAVRLAKKEFERQIAKNIKKDSKSFFAYARSKSRVKNAVGPLMNDKGSLVSTDREMGDLLIHFLHLCSRKKTLITSRPLNSSFMDTNMNNYALLILHLILLDVKCRS